MENRNNHSSQFLSRFSLFLMLPLLLFAACKGPEGPQGPEGQEGPQGPQGPQGEQGPGAKIYNINLVNHADSAALGAFTTNSANDTTSRMWAVQIDTMLTGMNITDTMFVQTYVKVPGMGYRTAPLEMVYKTSDGMLQLDSVGVESGSYSQVKYNLADELGTSNLMAPMETRMENKAFYWFAPDNNGYIQFMIDDGTATAKIMERNQTPSTNYQSMLYSMMDNSTTPLDNDLTDPAENSYPTANTSGVINYMEQTSDLTALKDTLGSDLYHTSIGASVSGGSGGAMHGPNPTRLEVHVRSTWNSDSISVAGVVKGMNYGNDKTVYLPKPVEVRVAVTGGDLAQEMMNGKKVPYDIVLDAANK